MKLENEFHVAVPLSEAWRTLTDLERIAPMLPGAQLQEVDGDEYRGMVKVKVGPIAAQYKGTATIVEQDQTAGRVVLRASGRDTRGQGNANAIITATMTPAGDTTQVSVVTDLTLTGKVAQFGRGVLAEVSAKLLDQFAETLHNEMAASRPSSTLTGVSGSEAGHAAQPRVIPGGPASSPPAASGPRRIDSVNAEPLDLLSLAGASSLRRLSPFVGLLALVVVALVYRRRSST